MKTALTSLLLLSSGANAVNIRGTVGIEGTSQVASLEPSAEEVNADLNPLNVANPSGLAIQKMVESQQKVSKLYAKSQATCMTEQKLTIAWQNEVQDMGNKARRESKQQLLGALEKRLAGLKKFVRRLKVMRGRLREHIVRVNSIFSTKYKENLDNVHVASHVLKELGMIQTNPWNPHLNPIKNFAALDAAGDESATGAGGEGVAEAEESSPDSEASTEDEGTNAPEDAAKPSALIAIAQKTRGECKSATGAAFNVYELGLKLNSMMDKSFESEREVLKEFRETLKMMIDKREAKLKALEEQIAKLKESLAAAAAPFTELKKGLDTHIEHIKAACAEHTKQGADVNAKIGAVVALIKENHLAGGDASSATGASDVSATGAAESASF